MIIKRKSLSISVIKELIANITLKNDLKVF